MVRSLFRRCNIEETLNLWATIFNFIWIIEENFNINLYKKTLRAASITYSISKNGERYINKSKLYKSQPYHKFDLLSLKPYPLHWIKLLALANIPYTYIVRYPYAISHSQHHSKIFYEIPSEVKSPKKYSVIQHKIALSLIYHYNRFAKNHDTQGSNSPCTFNGYRNRILFRTE